MDEDKKSKPLLLRVLKKIKISHLLILAFLLIGNTYAWFIYIDTVSNSTDVYIKKWNIDIADDQGTVTDNVTFTVDSVYPGMNTFEKEVNITNYSDVGATVNYSILEYTIMGERTVTKEGKIDGGIVVIGNEPTSDEVKNILANNYPFKITFDIDNEELSAEDGSAVYTIAINWPYESGNDELDTQWGQRAYEFIEANPDTPCINMVVKVIIQQDN